MTTMKAKVEELQRRRAQVMLGGGADKLDKHRASGKLTARERIDALVDAGSFQETGLFAKHRATLFGMEGKDMPADGVVTGAAAIGSFDTATFTTTGSLPNGSLGEWTHIVADGTTMLFYNRLDGSAAIATVTPTGLTTNTSFQPGSFGTWTHVVIHGSTILFYNRDHGASAIGTLTPTGFKTNTSYKSGSFDHWTHIVADGATLLFYNQDTRDGAIGTLT